MPTVKSSKLYGQDDELNSLLEGGDTADYKSTFTKAKSALDTEISKREGPSTLKKITGQLASQGYQAVQEGAELIGTEETAKFAKAKRDFVEKSFLGRSETGPSLVEGFASGVTYGGSKVIETLSTLASEVPGIPFVSGNPLLVLAKPSAKNVLDKQLDRIAEADKIGATTYGTLTRNVGPVTQSLAIMPNAGAGILNPAQSAFKGIAPRLAEGAAEIGASSGIVTLANSEGSITERFRESLSAAARDGFLGTILNVTLGGIGNVYRSIKSGSKTEMEAAKRSIGENILGDAPKADQSRFLDQVESNLATKDTLGVTVDPTDILQSLKAKFKTVEVPQSIKTDEQAREFFSSQKIQPTLSDVLPKGDTSIQNIKAKDTVTYGAINRTPEYEQRIVENERALKAFGDEFTSKSSNPASVGSIQNLAKAHIDDIRIQREAIESDIVTSIQNGGANYKIKDAELKAYDELTQAHNDVKAIMDKNFAKVPEYTSPTLGAEKIKQDLLGEIGSDAFTRADLESSPALKTIFGQDKLSVSELGKAVTRLNGEIRSRMAKSEGREALGDLFAARDFLDNKYEALIATRFKGADSITKAEANAAYREFGERFKARYDEIGGKFKQTAATTVFDRYRTGKLKQDEVLSTFILPDSGKGVRAGLEQLGVTYGDKALAGERTKEFLLSKLYTNLAANTANPSKVLETFKRQYSEAINYFPEVKKEFDSLGSEFTTYDTALAALQGKTKEAVYPLLTKISGGKKRVEDIIDTGLFGTKNADALDLELLTTQVGNSPMAKAELADAFSTRFSKNIVSDNPSTNNMFNWQKLDNLLTNPSKRQWLETNVGKDTVTDLERFRDAAKDISATGKTKQLTQNSQTADKVGIVAKGKKLAYNAFRALSFVPAAYSTNMVADLLANVAKAEKNGVFESAVADFILNPKESVAIMRDVINGIPPQYVQRARAINDTISRTTNQIVRGVETINKERGVEPAVPDEEEVQQPSQPAAYGEDDELNNLLDSTPSGTVPSTPATTDPDKKKVEIERTVSTPQRHSETIDYILQNGGKHARYYAMIAGPESLGAPDPLTAKNPDSSARGLFQFTKGTWADLVKQYGKQDGVSIGDINSREAQMKMIKRFTQRNWEKLRQDLKRDPTYSELYLAHFLGDSGGPSFIKALSKESNRNLPVSNFVSKDAFEDNRPVFTKNGRERTLYETYKHIRSKLS